MLHRTLVLLLILFVSIPLAMAQTFVSPTPVVIDLPTQGALPTDITISTPTPTWTPTAEAPVSLVLSAESANVRLDPDPSGELLGQLDAGVNYTVTGVYFSWYQFAFDQSPSGRGWVFGELVTINGDESLIPPIDPFSTPTAVVNLVPEGGTPDPNATVDVNVTAESDNLGESSRELEISSGNSSSSASGPLPTFTFPPDFVAARRTPTATGPIIPTATPDALEAAINTFAAGDMAPIVPVLLLAAGGALGLFVSFLRR
ncbi:hypothetical protein G4Y79_16115 [Phototrophicus methaneseepsis]|uniref:SH3b domain-containing protein n=1 Tax=Phototrophicus methaneseepsis TaxID=2710758 RepID=A0A7S8ID66_9CHLR|nr:hypothetical protein [Phototrophicus methaneseepsis]QPC81226.1 hypothetical protein G4Y79_16115 [Phototrophicus methaneseepsis]